MPSRDPFDETKPARGIPEEPVNPPASPEPAPEPTVTPDPVVVDETITELPTIEIKGTPDFLKNGPVSLSVAGHDEPFILPESGESITAPADIAEAVKFSPAVEIVEAK